MRIAVLIKEVPDTWGERRLDLETGLADRATSSAVLDEVGERALEVALAYADRAPGTEVVTLTMAPASAETSIRRALAMGASRAVRVTDDGLLGADLGLTAQVLAAALTRTGFDLVIAGNQSTDGVGGVLPAMLAELLEIPNATNLAEVTITDTGVEGNRTSDVGTIRVRASLPAVISVTEKAPDPRIANFKGIVAAKKKPIEALTLGELGVDADEHVPRAILVEVGERPPRQAGRTIVDDGTAGAQLVAFLAENRTL